MKKKMILFWLAGWIAAAGLFGCDSGKKGPASYRSQVMLTLFSIDTDKDFRVRLPEADGICPLTELVDEGGVKAAQGRYTAGEERGRVGLDYMKILAVDPGAGASGFYFTAPFFVSNQGTGVFYYLGLFVLDKEALSVRHLDSVFLGDRVGIADITGTGNEVRVGVKTRSQGRSMAESPDRHRELRLKVGAGGFVSVPPVPPDTGLPPLGLIVNNMNETDLTADITLSQCRITFDTDLYVTFDCQARVNRVFRSVENGIPGRIRYVRTLEKGLDGAGAQNDRRLLVSADKKGGAGAGQWVYVNPDVAYAFEYSQDMAALFEAAVQTKGHLQ